METPTETQRRRQGELRRDLLPGLLVIVRTVLEWRPDPTSGSRITEATGTDVEVVVVCRLGYSSSLAAGLLRALGLSRSTDLAGGVEAWPARPPDGRRPGRRPGVTHRAEEATSEVPPAPG